jgi:hypothetical protein
MVDFIVLTFLLAWSGYLVVENYRLRKERDHVPAKR